MAFVSKKRAEAEKAAESVAALREKLKSDSLAGVYVFHGNEEYTKRHYYGELKKSAGDNTNIVEFYGDEFSFTDFYDAVYTAPDIDYSESFFDDALQSEKKYRIARAFDPKLSSLSAKEEESLIALCKNPPDTIIAVFWFSAGEDEKKFSKGFLKKLCDNATEVVFMHEPPGSVKLRKWSQRHVSAEGYFMDDRTADYFLSVVGNDMTVLSFELQKLCAYMSKREEKKITFEEIDSVCIRTEEAKIEELADAVLRGEIGKAQGALSLLLRDKTSETYILGAISNRVSQLCGVYAYRAMGMPIGAIASKLGIWESKVKSALATLSELNIERNPKKLDDFAKIVAEYDRKLKSSPCDKGILLSDMVLAISRKINRK